MSAEMTHSHELRVVVFREGDYWVAQCLEYDIGAQAKDLSDLQARFALTLEAERQESIKHHGKPFAGIDPAPRHFHEMWERRSGEYRPLADRPSSRDDDAPAYDMALYG